MRYTFILNNAKNGKYPPSFSICQELLSGHLSGKTIAHKIHTELKKLQTAHPHLNLETIFIAAPQNEENFCNEIKAYFKEKEIAEVYHQHDLWAFIKQKFHKCDERIFNHQIHDFMSQVEMELCFRSKVFAGSEVSGWSAGVGHERRVRGMDGIDFSNFRFF